jgi:tetratricopeptide (TPR) repeat protein
MCSNLEKLNEIVASNDMNIEIYDYILQNIKSFTKKDLKQIRNINKNCISTIAILIYMVWCKQIYKEHDIQNYKKYVDYLIKRNNIYGYYYDAVFDIFNKHYDEALIKLKDILKKDNTFYIVHIKIATTILNNKCSEIDTAIKYLEEALLLGSKHPYYVLGLVYKGVYNSKYININKSIEMFNKSIESNAFNKYFSADALGTTYLKYKSNMLHESFKYYKLASDNELFESHYNLLYLLNTTQFHLMNSNEIIELIVKYLTHKRTEKTNTGKRRFILQMLKKNMKNNLHTYITNYIEIVTENKRIIDTNNNIKSMIYYHPTNDGYVETLNHYNKLCNDKKQN